MRDTVALIGLAVAAWLILLPAVAEAHTPTAGWQRLYTADSQALSWGFGGTYASWLAAPAIAALDTNFADRTTNNSRAPIFSYSSGGSDGTVWLKVASTSPCGTGRVDWLQCANGGGTFGFNIYVRDLYNTSSDYSNWSWYDKTGSCPSGRTCWYLRRTFIHEVQHITIGVGGHDGQGESNTVMAATTPWSPNTGWNQTRIRRCDEAAEQMAYDLDDFSGPYGDCLDHVTNAGVSGLKNYHTRNGNPLAGRVRRLDRDGVASTYTTKATSVSGNNWSLSVSGSGNATHAFVAHFDDASGDGLADSDRVAFNVTWSAAC